MIKLHHRVTTILSIAFLLSAVNLVSQPVQADQYTEYGLAMLKKRDFATAQKYFEQRLKLSPNDTKALYYKAVCYHHTKDLASAKAIYQDLVNRFPTSEMGKLAQANLTKMNAAEEAANPGAAKANPGAKAGTKAFPDKKIELPDDFDEEDLQAALSGKAKASTDVIPDSTKVYFKRSGKGDDIIVMGEINGRPIEMCFDTGASGMFLGRNHLSQLGLHVSDKAKAGLAGGVGGLVTTHEVELVIGLGGIKRKLNCMVSEEFDTYPLLGQTFFRDLEYEFDNKGGCIYFRKAVARDITKDHYSVPFRRAGNHVVVDVEGPGGTKTGMIVDTGAAMTCFTATNMAQLKMSVPDDAQKMMMRGVGGSQEAYRFNVSELRLGPVIQRDHEVSVPAGGSGMLSGGRPHGLLGQPFFSDWRFTVDNKNRCLRFFH